MAFPSLSKVLGPDTGNTFLWALAFVTIGVLVETGKVSPEMLNYLLMALIGKAAMPVLKKKEEEDGPKAP